jgi:hypothetical protein
MPILMMYMKPQGTIVSPVKAASVSRHVQDTL